VQKEEKTDRETFKLAEILKSETSLRTGMRWKKVIAETQKGKS